MCFYTLNRLIATSTSPSFDISVWLAIFISVASLCVGLWRNRYDVGEDKDKRIKEMIAKNAARIETLEDKIDRKLEKIDDVTDRLHEIVNQLGQQVVKLSTQVSFLVKAKRED